METPKDLVEQLEKGRPGYRFERLYEKRQRSRHGALKHWLFIVGGLLAIAAGVLTYAIPIIPSDVLIVLGVAFMSQGSRWGARALDRAELWFRRHFGWFIAKWRRFSRPTKWLIYFVWLGLVGALSYWAYRALL